MHGVRSNIHTFPPSPKLMMRSACYGKTMELLRFRSPISLHHFYQLGGMSITQLGKEPRLSISHVSRLIAKVKKEKWEP